MENQPQNSIPEIKPAHHLPLKYWLPALVVFALLAGTLIYYCTYVFDIDLDSEVSVSESQTVKNQADQQEDWKTYRNEEFEFEYPKEAQTISDFSQNMPGSRPNIQGVEFTFSGNIYTIEQPASMSMFNSLADWINNAFDADNDITHYNNVIVGNQKGYSHKTEAVTYTALNDKVYKLYASEASDGKQVQSKNISDPIYSHLISSFRFTNQTSQADTAGWKTYQNDTYGFEIKYPKDWIIEYPEIGFRGIQVYFWKNKSSPQFFWVNVSDHRIQSDQASTASKNLLDGLPTQESYQDLGDYYILSTKKGTYYYE